MTVDTAQVQQELATAINASVAATASKYGVTIPWLVVVEVRPDPTTRATAILGATGSKRCNDLLAARNELPRLLTSTFEWPFERPYVFPVGAA